MFILHERAGSIHGALDGALLDTISAVGKNHEAKSVSSGSIDPDIEHRRLSSFRRQGETEMDHAFRMRFSCVGPPGCTGALVLSDALRRAGRRRAGPGGGIMWPHLGALPATGSIAAGGQPAGLPATKTGIPYVPLTRNVLHRTAPRIRVFVLITGATLQFVNEPEREAARRRVLSAC